MTDATARPNNQHVVSLRRRIWSLVRMAVFIIFTVALIQHKILLSDSIFVNGRIQIKSSTTGAMVEPSSTTRAILAVVEENYSSTGVGSSTGQNNGGKRRKPVTLHLIGERHTGTNWMTDHLEKCFPQFWIDTRFSRFKHWFQDKDGLFHSRIGERQVVVAQFRNVYTWVESMRKLPYHSIEHYHLGWHDFVTRPWTMKRFGKDAALDGVMKHDFFNTTMKDSRICKRAFAPFEVIPCLEGNVDLYSPRRVRTRAAYELKRDGSGQPFSNILELRQAKIRNFMSVRFYESVRRLYVVRYEDMVLQGTDSLLRQLEKELNTTAKCVPDPSKPLVIKRKLQPEYVKYMRKHVDWEAERMIGYSRDDIF